MPSSELDAFTVEVGVALGDADALADVEGVADADGVALGAGALHAARASRLAMTGIRRVLDTLARVPNRAMRADHTGAAPRWLQSW